MEDHPAGCDCPDCRYDAGLDATDDDIDDRDFEDDNGDIEPW